MIAARPEKKIKGKLGVDGDVTKVRSVTIHSAPKARYELFLKVNVGNVLYTFLMEIKITPKKNAKR